MAKKKTGPRAPKVKAKKRSQAKTKVSPRPVKKMAKKTVKKTVKMAAAVMPIPTGVMDPGEDAALAGSHSLDDWDSPPDPYLSDDVAGVAMYDEPGSDG